MAGVTYLEKSTFLRRWRDAGSFTKDGRTYEWPKDHAEAMAALELTLSDLDHHFDTAMNHSGISGGPGEGPKAKGFQVGRGRTLYWYISPTRYGGIRCFPTDENGNLGYPRYFRGQERINIVYEKEQTH